eukprot:gnl/MRDRNA2_/MRDRNA2_88866_c0_seq1.p1 gnl/MRDRNA2_/MRDRNA2_88866_c0~~gnl/MRDRNA2_/MRDRNA2_88866_c0_seq1.p1  ORF type:complete len:359 (+),score=61.86 gnl/MRDRNA2_/MRDRNA2_88866_c0_seq1:91-1077(+)
MACTGVVKFFKFEVGWGFISFISTEGDSKDVYFHENDVKSTQILDKGDKVCFNMGSNRDRRGRDRPCAKEIQRTGLTPAEELFEAVSNGQEQIVSTLLSARADPNIKKNSNLLEVQRFDSMSPLFIAARDGHTSIVTMLLEAGAEPDATTGCTKCNVDLDDYDLPEDIPQERVTPKEIAHRHGHHEIERIIDDFPRHIMLTISILSQTSGEAELSIRRSLGGQEVARFHATLRDTPAKILDTIVTESGIAKHKIKLVQEGKNDVYTHDTVGRFGTAAEFLGLVLRSGPRIDALEEAQLLSTLHASSIQVPGSSVQGGSLPTLSDACPL